MADAIRVCVSGFRGRVGLVLVPALQSEPGIEYVGGIGRGDDLAAFLHEKRPRVLVDFTKPAEALHIALAAVAAGASPVVGTTGIPADGIDKLETACKDKGLAGMRAPNSASGAALMTHLAELAPPHSEGGELGERH